MGRLELRPADPCIDAQALKSQRRNKDQESENPREMGFMKTSRIEHEGYVIAGGMILYLFAFRSLRPVAQVLSLWRAGKGVERTTLKSKNALTRPKPIEIRLLRVENDHDDISHFWYGRESHQAQATFARMHKTRRA